MSLTYFDNSDILGLTPKYMKNGFIIRKLDTRTGLKSNIILRYSSYIPRKLKKRKTLSELEVDLIDDLILGYLENRKFRNPIYFDECRYKLYFGFINYGLITQEFEINWCNLPVQAKQEIDFIPIVGDINRILFNKKKNKMEDFKIGLVKTASDYATRVHSEANHMYGKYQYSYHLNMVYYFGCKFSYLLKDNDKEFALASCWTHDTIEDARQTYNDVKKVCGEEVAEITYALTNDKGRTRKERAGENYYEGIRNTPLARFVKICDRLANVKFSRETNSRMLEVYSKENQHFKDMLYLPELEPMFVELDKYLNETAN